MPWPYPSGLCAVGGWEMRGQWGRPLAVHTLPQTKATEGGGCSRLRRASISALCGQASKYFEDTSANKR